MVSFRRGYSPRDLADITGVAITITVSDEVFDSCIPNLAPAILLPFSDYIVLISFHFLFVFVAQSTSRETGRCFHGFELFPAILTGKLIRLISRFCTTGVYWEYSGHINSQLLKDLHNRSMMILFLAMLYMI
jgi:hypothetical protein